MLLVVVDHGLIRGCAEKRRNKDKKLDNPDSKLVPRSNSTPLISRKWSNNNVTSSPLSPPILFSFLSSVRKWKGWKRGREEWKEKEPTKTVYNMS